MISVIKADGRTELEFLAKVEERNRSTNDNVSAVVKEIIENVRVNGDNAVREYTIKFDGILLFVDAYSSYTDAQFKTAMNGKYLAYELATPTSLSLTPINPKTISGVNNIYNDCGDTDIEYFTESADGLVALIEVLSNS